MKRPSPADLDAIAERVIQMNEEHVIRVDVLENAPHRADILDRLPLDGEAMLVLRHADGTADITIQTATDESSREPVAYIEGTEGADGRIIWQTSHG